MTEQMLMNPTKSKLTPQDSYVLARALVGLPYDALPLSPIMSLLLANLDPAQPEDVQILRRVLGQQLMLEVLRVDPEGAAPETPFRSTDLNVVPELPENARLSDAQISQAQTVGKWLDDYELSVTHSKDFSDFYLNGGDRYAWLTGTLKRNYKESLT